MGGVGLMKTILFQRNQDTFYAGLMELGTLRRCAVQGTLAAGRGGGFTESLKRRICILILLFGGRNQSLIAKGRYERSN